VVLARAVKWFTEHRILLNGHKTVIFNWPAVTDMSWGRPDLAKKNADADLLRRRFCLPPHRAERGCEWQCTGDSAI